MAEDNGNDNEDDGIIFLLSESHSVWGSGIVILLQEPGRIWHFSLPTSCTGYSSKEIY